MSRSRTHGHLSVVNNADNLVPLMTVTATSPSQFSSQVVAAARTWAAEVDALGLTTGAAPIVDSGIGQAAQHLLDAVHELENVETNGAVVPLGVGWLPREPIA